MQVQAFQTGQDGTAGVVGQPAIDAARGELRENLKAVLARERGAQEFSFTLVGIVGAVNEHKQKFGNHPECRERLEDRRTAA